MRYKPWVKVYRGFLTERRSEFPSVGVWITSTRGIDQDQHTIEQIALNGQVLRTLDCYCGADRHRAWAVARDLSMGKGVFHG